MTLVYSRQRDDNHPTTHALVLGIGRFSQASHDPKLNRETCVASAEAVVNFLVEHADDFLQPLDTIECLLSDPAVDPGQASDTLAQTDPQFDRRGDETIERGTSVAVNQACEDWLERCRPGDSLFLYVCSHGVAGRDENGLLVLEDYDSTRLNRSDFLLNVGSIARFAPAGTGAGAVWVFMDACQEYMDELIDTIEGVRGIVPVEATTKQMAQTRVRSCALAAARVGQAAWAPDARETAYFTKALLEGLGSCCVEQQGMDWVVTPKHILYGLESVAIAVFEKQLDTEPLSMSSQSIGLLRVTDPKIPMRLTTIPEILMDDIDEAELYDAYPPGAKLATRSDTERIWRCRVPAGVLKVKLQMKKNHSRSESCLNVFPPAYTNPLVPDWQ